MFLQFLKCRMVHFIVLVLCIILLILLGCFIIVLFAYLIWLTVTMMSHRCCEVRDISESLI